MNVNRKTLLAFFCLTLIASVSITFVVAYNLSQITINMHSTLGIDFESFSIHTLLTFYKEGELYDQQYHAGAVTDLGDNLTLAKLFGDSDYLITYFMNNCTYISIGNQGSLSTSSTQLPGEWNRTTAVVDNESNSYLNISCTFYPDSGPYTADCIGINWASSGDGSLWGYDTFSEVTGIDDTFTINVDIKISVSHS